MIKEYNSESESELKENTINGEGISSQSQEALKKREAQLNGLDRVSKNENYSLYDIDFSDFSQDDEKDEKAEKVLNYIRIFIFLINNILIKETIISPKKN